MRRWWLRRGFAGAALIEVAAASYGFLPPLPADPQKARQRRVASRALRRSAQRRSMARVCARSDRAHRLTAVVGLARRGGGQGWHRGGNCAELVQKGS